MVPDIYVTGPRDKRNQRPPDNCTVVGTVSGALTASAALSPFRLGPCPLYAGAPARRSLTMENLWQYCKVYYIHADKDGSAGAAYRHWAKSGFDNPRAVRYPCGKGVKPLYSLWAGERLDYVTARKRIYVPQYVVCVVTCSYWLELLQLSRSGQPIALWDYDGYNHRARGLDLLQVLNDPSVPCGHAFILCALLTGVLDPGEVLEHMYHGSALTFGGEVIAPAGLALDRLGMP